MSEDHWAVLAGTRFFLAAVVMNAHFGMALLTSEHAPLYRFGRSLGPLAAIVGFVAISGFSIAHSVEVQRGFYARRLGRIWPTLAVTVAGYVALLTLFGPAITTTGNVRHFVPAWYGVVATLLFMNGLVVGSFLGPTWSLAVEAIYYVAAPVLRRTRPRLLAVMIAASACLYFFNRHLALPGLPGVLYGLAAASLFWAWGLGFVAYRYRGRSVLPTVALLLLGALLLGWYNYEGGVVAIFTFEIAACAIAFGGHASLGAPGRAVLNYLGDLSYPVFLMHYPVIVALSGVLRLDDYAIYAAVTLALATACLHLVDRPARRTIAASRLAAVPVEDRASWLVAAIGAIVAAAALARW